MLTNFLRKALDRLRFHWQNLNERPGDVLGPPIKGRAWLRFGRLGINPEWNFWSHFCHAKVRFGDEKHLTFALALPPVAFWLSFEHPGLSRRFESLQEQEIGLSVHDGSIWWALLTDSTSWSSSMPRWRNGNFNVFDFLLGKVKYTTRDIEEFEVEVPLPECGYKGTIRMFESTWKRPRWFAERLMRANIEMLKPIPIPGKGENSWDCGDDATYGITIPANSPEEAVGKLVTNILETRRKRGSEWKWIREI